jgi:5-bromo-4-chloroindolyl phosphate hydrolysis protein
MTDASGSPSGSRRQKIYAGVKGILLFVLPLPLLFKAIGGLWGGDLESVVVTGGAYALCLAGALLMRKGLLNEIQHNQRPFSRTSPPPLKTIGASLLGIGTMVATHLAAGHNLVISVLFGIGAIAGSFMAYGFDPKKKAKAAGDHGVGRDQFTRTLSEAYAKLDRINETRLRISSREFQERLGGIVEGSQRILRAIEDDPRDLRRARKFLSVYLDGIGKVSEQYVRTHPKTQTPVLEENYRNLLVDMENVCNEQYERLMQNDVFDLDVQIEVLSTRLKREGVI